HAEPTDDGTPGETPGTLPWPIAPVIGRNGRSSSTAGRIGMLSGSEAKGLAWPRRREYREKSSPCRLTVFPKHEVLMVYSGWPAMPRNGSKTGTIRIIINMPRSQTPRVRFEVRSKPCAAGHGSNRLPASAQLIAIGARWTAVPAAPAFVAQKTRISQKQASSQPHHHPSRVDKIMTSAAL